MTIGAGMSNMKSKGRSVKQIKTIGKEELDDEMEQSLSIIEQAIDHIPDGDVASAIPKRIRPPVGDAYVRSESPRGEIGFYIISDGSTSPYRVKARSPAFVNLSVCPDICRGYMISDIVAIVGSVDIVLGEVDR